MRQESSVSYRLWRLAVGTVPSIGLPWLAARGVSWAEVAAGLGSVRTLEPDRAWRILVVDRSGCEAPSPLNRTLGRYIIRVLRRW